MAGRLDGVSRGDYRKCAEIIVGSAVRNGFEWVVEVLFIVKRSRLIVEEVPIAFVDRRDGRTKLKNRDILRWGFYAGRSLFT